MSVLASPSQKSQTSRSAAYFSVMLPRPDSSQVASERLVFVSLQIWGNKIIQRQTGMGMGMGRVVLRTPWLSCPRVLAE